MKLELSCTDYSIDRRANHIPELVVRFMVVTEKNKFEEVAEALKRIELFLAGRVNLVKSDGSPRCFHCGVKQSDDAQVCTQCGAPL